MLVPTRSGAVVLLIVAVIVLFLPAAGMRDWWYPDEPDVALPAIEMQARGDWAVPTHNDTAWLDYPPLAYWGARVVGLVSGEITPFGTRVPMVLFACLMVFATVRLGGRLLDQRSALVAGVILIATPIFWFHAANLQVDLGYAAFQAAGLALYVAGDARSGSPSVWYRIAAFACFGVAILGKGPLGVLLPGLILTCWHAWNREWRRLLELAPLSLAAIAVALPWYVALCDKLGTDFVLNQLYLQNFDRFGQSNRGHGDNGFFYYFGRIWPDLGLWSALILPTLWSGFRNRRNDRSWRLLVIWMLAPFIFFTLASTKRNVYLLPIYPAIALLVADWLMRAELAWELAWSTWSARILAGVLLFAGVLLAFAVAVWPLIPWPKKIPLPADTMASLRWPGLVVSLWLLLMAGWSFRAALAKRFSAWFGLAATGAIGYSIAMWLVMPVIDTALTYRPAAAWLAERVPAGGTVGFYSPGREAPKRPSWLCHMGGGRRLKFFSTPQEASAWLAADPERLLLTEPQKKDAPTPEQVVKVIQWRISSDEWAVLAAAVAVKPNPSTN